MHCIVTELREVATDREDRREDGLRGVPSNNLAKKICRELDVPEPENEE